VNCLVLVVFSTKMQHSVVFLLSLLGRVAMRSIRCRLLLHSTHVAWFVSLSVTNVSPTKMDDPTAVPFGMWTREGSRNHVADRCTLAPPGEYD